MENHLVFVYGTLRKGNGNNRLLNTSELISEGALTKEAIYYMTGHGIPFVDVAYDTEGYLFKHLNPGKIRGDLYKVNDHTLSRLDALESHPDWYERKLIRVVGDVPHHGKCGFTAWCYLNNTAGKYRLREAVDGIYDFNHIEEGVRKYA